MKKFLTFGFLALFTLSIIGCSDSSDDDGGGGTPPPASTSGTITGQVANYTDGVAIAGVNIVIGNQQATTAADGSYTLTDVPNASRIIVVASKDGYARSSKIVELSSTITTANANVNLLPVAFSGSYDPTQDFTAQDTGSPANVVIAANTLVDGNGNAASGSITTELTPINPTLDIDLMPGDMTISGGDPIASYGAVTIEFTNAAGDQLNLSQGSTATVRIPATNRGGAALPTSIPLFYYNEAQGVWVEEGTATLSADGTYYEGTVEHFTTWNADYLYDFGNITGCVQDIDGNRVANIIVSMEGQDYSGSASTRTNSNGEFTIPAMIGARSLVVASTGSNISNSVITTAPTVLTECLLVGSLSGDSLSVSLTWGESPRDLDTHVIGPDSFHIYYGSRGSLISEPFANLDVDDVSGFGPEVFTALRFATAGTYHYAIYNFSGTHTPNITNSPARVELSLDGLMTVFTPPAGESDADRWWNVFDIVVDTSGNISIIRINTWSPTAPTASARRAMQFMPAK